MDPQALELMLPLMICDSSSYTFLLLKDAEKANNAEFKQSHLEVMEAWQSNYDSAIKSNDKRDAELEQLGFYDAPKLYRERALTGLIDDPQPN